MTLFTRINNHFKTLKWNDFLRKIIFYLEELFTFKIFRRIKSHYHFKRFDIQLGRNVTIVGLCTNICVGKNVAFYNNTVFEFGPQSKIVIGNDVLFSYGVLFSINKEVSIGNYVQIGEYTSIRDTTHQYTVLNQPMKLVSDVSEKVIIGNDVWIGRGCIILPGSVIEDGVVIAANSVVKGILNKNGIYAGNPVKFIKSRIIKL